jgi:hypothetical protein
MHAEQLAAAQVTDRCHDCSHDQRASCAHKTCPHDLGPCVAGARGGSRGRGQPAAADVAGPRRRGGAAARVVGAGGGRGTGTRPRPRLAAAGRGRGACRSPAPAGGGCPAGTRGGRAGRRRCTGGAGDGRVSVLI